MLLRRARTLFGVISTLLLTACASPVYKVVYDYIPPPSSNGAACAMDCQAAQQSCQRPCDEGYNDCMARSHEEARRTHQDDKERYTRDLERYNDDLERYYSDLSGFQEHERDLQDDQDRYDRKCHSEPKDKHACKRLDDVTDELRRMREPTKPTKPQEPNYSETLKEQQGVCSRECGCEVQYNGCYTACGGRVQSRKVCVENCD